MGELVGGKEMFYAARELGLTVGQLAESSNMWQTWNAISRNLRAAMYRLLKIEVRFTKTPVST